MPKHLVEELLEFNKTQSEAFMSADQVTARKLYRRDHPAEVVVLKCMDGRVNMPLLTKTPMGIMTPIRNIGGIFDLGWPALQHRLNEIVEYVEAKRRRNLMIATYHFAKGDLHRGCRGHNYDVDKAKVCALKLRDDIEQVFGKDHVQVYPIMVGIETDSEALVFHDWSGKNAATMMEYIGAEDARFRELVNDLYPGMSAEFVNDILPLMKGNAEHVREVQGINREPVHLEHMERVLAIGQGFDWLHRENYALIINDLDPQMDDAIAAAAGIIKKNREMERIPSTGALLFAAVSYMRLGHVRNEAVIRAKYLTRLGMETIRKHYPDFLDFFHPVTAVVNFHTRQLEIIE